MVLHIKTLKKKLSTNRRETKAREDEDAYQFYKCGVTALAELSSRSTAEKKKTVFKKGKSHRNSIMEF